MNHQTLEQQVAAYQQTSTHTLNPDAQAKASAATAMVVSENDPSDDTIDEDAGQPCHDAHANASASEIWDESFDNIWDKCLTAADMSKESAWVKDSVQRYEDTKNDELPLGASKGDPTRVATAQGSARLGMHFFVPKGTSQVRCYENEMFGFVQ